MLFLKSDKESLLKPIQIVSGIIEQQTPLPILSNILIKKDQDKIFFIGTDLGLQIKTTIKNNQPTKDINAISVSGKKFLDILRVLPSHTEISLQENDNRLNIKSGKSKFNLQTLLADNFPIFKEEIEPKSTITIQQKQLKKLLRVVHFAIAQQDLRYYLKGLYLRIDTHLTVIATDTHRLGYNRLELDKAVVKKETIVPRKAIIELNKLLSENDDPISIEIYKNRVNFIFSDIELTSKLIDGHHPSYDNAIPRENKILVKLNRLIFLQGLQRVSILANTHDNFREVRLIFSRGTLQIRCKNIQQEEALEEITVEYDYDEVIDINFNITYLLDLLNNVSNDTIYCAFKDSFSSILITLQDDQSFKYVVMPMKI